MGEMLKVGWMRERYIYCRGYASYRLCLQHLSVLNPPSVATSIRPQRLEKTVAKLKMFRMGEMELEDVVAGDGNPNVFKPLPPMTVSIGTNEPQAPDCTFWMNHLVQFLRWGYKISESSFRELFCCDVGVTSSCLMERFIPPDIACKAWTELITLYNRASRWGLEFIEVAAAIHEPIGRYTPALLFVYSISSDNVSFLTVRRMEEGSRRRSWMGFMQGAPQLVPCFVLADRGGSNVRYVNGMSTPLLSKNEIFENTAACRGGSSLMVASWKDFKKWKGDSRKVDRKK